MTNGRDAPPVVATFIASAVFLFVSTMGRYERTQDEYRVESYTFLYE